MGPRNTSSCGAWRRRKHALWSHLMLGARCQRRSRSAHFGTPELVAENAQARTKKSGSSGFPKHANEAVPASRSRQEQSRPSDRPEIPNYPPPPMATRRAGPNFPSVVCVCLSPPSSRPPTPCYPALWPPAPPVHGRGTRGRSRKPASKTVDQQGAHAKVGRALPWTLDN